MACHTRTSLRRRTVGRQLIHRTAVPISLPASQFVAADALSRQRLLGSGRVRTPDVMVKGYVHEVVIHWRTQEIARDARRYEKHDAIHEPRHYLPLLEPEDERTRPGGAVGGMAVAGSVCADTVALESRHGKKGKREYVHILRLLKHFSLQEVQASLQQALQVQAISFDALKHLVLCRIERKPPRLDLENYPHPLAAQAARTAASAARVRQSRTAMCQRGYRLSALLVATG